MLFLLQTFNKEIKSVEVFNLKDILDRNKLLHEYELREIEEIDTLSNNYKNAIPVGSIEFVTKFLSKFYNINNLEPIEVPLLLRKKDYLKRDYKIVSKENLPTKGYYFIKYVSKLKEFSYIGNIESIPDEKSQIIDDLCFYKKNGLYQISEVVNILSEYRVFVNNDEIVGIQYYNGDCTVFPNTNIIKEMVNVYSLDKNRPLAYTMDIAVIKEKGTAILEIHPCVSVGTYSFMGSSLLYMYRAGIDYYINKNIKIKAD